MEVSRDKIIQALEQKNANKPCHRCGNESFALSDQFSNIILSDSVGGALVLGGPIIPTAIVVCNKCGAVTFHALGTLGLLEGGE